MNTLEKTLGADFLLFIEKISNKYAVSYSDAELLKSICIEKYYTIMSSNTDSIGLKDNFLRKAISRTCIDFARAHSRLEKRNVSYHDPYFAEGQLAASANIDEFLEFHSIVTYIEKLPCLEKEWINCFLEGMTYKDISVKYNLPMGTVKKRILQARSRWMRDLGLNYSLAKF